MPRRADGQAPVTYARKFHTPMLIIHGGNDYRVDPSQGLSMFQVLQARHVPSKLLYFETEGHWVLKPADSVLWYHTVLGWIDQWVKPDRAEYQRLLTASASSGAPGVGSGATALTWLAWFRAFQSSSGRNQDFFTHATAQ